MTAFDDELAELAAEFIDSDITGYLSGEHNNKNIAGIFQRRYIESERIQGFRPLFTITAKDASSISHGDEIIINENTFIVRESQSDGAGMVNLVLEG